MEEEEEEVVLVEVGDGGRQRGWGVGGEKEVLIRVTGHLPRSLWEPRGSEQTRRGNSNRYAVD